MKILITFFKKLFGKKSSQITADDLISPEVILRFKELDKEIKSVVDRLEQASNECTKKFCIEQLIKAYGGSFTIDGLMTESQRLFDFITK